MAYWEKMLVDAVDSKRALDAVKPRVRFNVLSEINPVSWEYPSGGQHRTSQIHEVLAGSAVAVTTVDPTGTKSNLYKYFLGLKLLLESRGRWPMNPRLLRQYGASLQRLISSFDQYNGEKVFLWEITHQNNLALPYVAARAGFSTIALPHNLEALVCRRRILPSERFCRRLCAEIKALRACAAVFCISREEQWLLAQFGISADYLPYYPPAFLRESLRQVREKRLLSRPRRILLLGSVGNPPTLAGMRKIIDVLKHFPNGTSLQVDIAGYQTERLRDRVDGTLFRLHGGVSQARLNELLEDTRAVIIHQDTGAGALTRIPEMLVAGIPVLANHIAARSASQYSGVHTYSSNEELFQLLDAPLETPDELEPPRKAEERFVEKLDAIALSKKGDRSAMTG
jgi:hypothetical protein